MAELETPDTLCDDLRTAWQRYIDMLVPLRPTLYGYCRRLAGNIWDAEDLVQDTLLRAFGHLGLINHRIRNPRAYLLRTATNVWIDEVRRRESNARALTTKGDDGPETSPSPDSSSDDLAGSPSGSDIRGNRALAIDKTCRVAYKQN